MVFDSIIAEDRGQVICSIIIILVVGILVELTGVVVHVRTQQRPKRSEFGGAPSNAKANYYYFRHGSANRGTSHNHIPIHSIVHRTEG